jgi:hypothetical protein
MKNIRCQSYSGDQPGCQRRADGGPDLGSQHVHADRQAALVFREMLAHPAEARGRHNGFARAGDDPQGGQFAQRTRQARGRRGQAPDHEADGIGNFDPVAIHQPAGGNLQQHVRPKERRVEESAIDVRQLKMLDEGLVRQRRRNIRSLQKGDDGPDAEEPDDDPAPGTDRIRMVGNVGIFHGGRLHCSHACFISSPTFGRELKLRSEPSL